MRCHHEASVASGEGPAPCDWLSDSSWFGFPTPVDFNWVWSLGLSGGCVAHEPHGDRDPMKMLAMHDGPHAHFVFASVQRPSTDAPSGVLLRHAHANAASMVCLTVVYMRRLHGTDGRATQKKGKDCL